MRLVTRKEFLSLPNGILFRKYEPRIFGELCIKRESIKDIDFFVQYLDWIEVDGTEEEHEVYERAEKHSSYEFFPEWDMEGRDGLFEEDQMFAIYSKEDVIGLIKLLESTL